LGLRPRIGYIVPMGDKLSFWPRAGVEYLNVSSSDVGSGSGSVTQFAVNVERCWSSRREPLRLHGRPEVDIPISGEQTTTSTPTGGGASTSTRVDSAMFQVGLSAGMLGHF